MSPPPPEGGRERASEGWRERGSEGAKEGASERAVGERERGPREVSNPLIILGILVILAGTAGLVYSFLAPKHPA